MKNLNSITIILLCCLAFAAMPTDASAQRQKGSRNQPVLRSRRKALERENKKKDAVIDSLLSIIESYREGAEIEEEATDRMMTIYDDGLIGSGLGPEDYNAEVTDSLLDIWYLHNLASGNSEGKEYNMDSVHFQSNVPDKVFIQRLSDMNSYITLPYNETVRNYILLYADKMPTKMSQMLGLAQYYFPIFEATFSKYGIPQELKYMAVIESALNPTARSRAGAYGMWQFMYNTARLYGLEINSYVDERLDVEKAADAAARYLRDSYGLFGDWNLAISSYNCGAGNVNKAIRRSGSREFWKIYDYLPRETRGYVPAFVGAMYAFKYYKEHGISPTQCNLPAHVDTIKVNKMLHFKQISAVAGIPEDVLVSLNPQYIHEIIPGKDKEYILRIPYNYTAAFVENEDSIYNYKTAEFFNPVVLENIKESGSSSSDRIVYKVKKGDYLGRIAARYHVKVSDIKKWNNLRNNNLSIGQRLVIYRKGTAKPAAQTQVKETAKPVEVKDVAKPDSLAVTKADSSAAQSSGTGTDGVVTDSTVTAPQTVASEETGSSKKTEVEKEEYVIYTVKKGDTLFGISKKYTGVTVDDIKAANNITDNNIRYGMKLKIPVK